MSKKVKPGSYSAGRKFEGTYINFNELFKGSQYKYVPDPDNDGYGRVYLDHKLVGETFEQTAFYDNFIRKLLPDAPLSKELNSRNKDIKSKAKAKLEDVVGWSNRHFPDGALYTHEDNKLHIFEVKFQTGTGTTHEKLLAGNGYKFMSEKSAERINKKDTDIKIEVVYIFIINEYLKNTYPDDFKFLDSVGIKYFVEEYPPLELFNL